MPQSAFNIAYGDSTERVRSTACTYSTSHLVRSNS